MAVQQNYFTTMIQRYNGNERFIDCLTPEQIQKSAKTRIFREMVKGQIDYTIHGPYFLESKFLENLIIAAQNELINKSIISAALQLYDSTYPGNAYVVHNLTVYQGLAQVYTVLHGKLNALKYSGDIGVMVDIPHILRDFKNLL